MKKLLITLFFLIICITFSPKPVFAIENPLAVPNNKIGIHILFPSEVDNAAGLVNSNGGDWGYVTIPIQSDDKDLVKWQNFMDECKKDHIIPIIRLATTGDYFNTQDWSKPNYNDIIDFANFLNSLNWPTRNRYVIIYNEVNRADEWGGSVDPAGYAQLLEYAIKEFKFVNPDFFIISAGMDNAAPTQGNQYMNEYQYYEAMAQAVPNIFSEIDGFSSHSYPNPGFIQPPTVDTPESIYSYKYEQNLLQQLGGKKLPVFITETGWEDDIVSDNTIVNYYQQAFNNAWNDPSIVAITPFLLNAAAGPFQPFSLMKPDGSQTEEYKFIKNLPKTKGQPVLNSTQVLAAATTKTFNPPTKYFPPLKNTYQPKFILPASVKALLKWLLKV